MKNFFFTYIILLCLTGCATKATTTIESNYELYSKEEVTLTRNMLIGSWYGEKLLDDGSQQKWVMTRFNDGTYSVKFQIKGKDGQIDQWSEEGIWGTKKPIYFTATRTYIEKGIESPANTLDAALYDAYRIIELTDKKFSYYSYSSGNIFTVKKVDNSFSF